MRKIKYPGFTILLVFFFTGVSFSQNIKNDLMLSLGYFNDNDHLQYLRAIAKTKVDGKFQQVEGVDLSFYISSESPGHLLGNAVTNGKGQVVMFIPSIAKGEWNKSSKQSFIVVSGKSNRHNAVHFSIDLTKARIRMDTLAGRKIIATLSELKDSVWIPVKGVDMKMAVKRLGGDLNVNETPTYTTDSLGTVRADFKQDKLPGDNAGNLILIAEVDDNDTYGNLTTEKSVPWGVIPKYSSGYDERSLFARRGWSPVWLEWMAYAIVVFVWGVLVYLFGQIWKLKRLGR